MHYEMVSGITGLCLLDASSTSPVVTTKVSPYIGKYPLGSKNATFRTTAFVSHNLWECESPYNGKHI